MDRLWSERECLHLQLQFQTYTMSLMLIGSQGNFLLFTYTQVIIIGSPARGDLKQVRPSGKQNRPKELSARQHRSCADGRMVLFKIMIYNGSDTI